MGRKDLKSKAIAYQSLFNLEGGNAVLHDLMDFCHLISNTYCGNRDEFLLNEGKRQVILYILANLNTDVQSLNERIKRKVEEEKQDANDDFNNTY